jgi:hypothetical protein
LAIRAASDFARAHADIGAIDVACTDADIGGTVDVASAGAMFPCGNGEAKILSSGKIDRPISPPAWPFMWEPICVHLGAKSYFPSGQLAPQANPSPPSVGDDDEKTSGPQS